MIRWIDRIESWDGNLPAALVTLDTLADERASLLRALAARALRLETSAVSIAQAEGRAPVIAAPMRSGIVLSMARRGALSAFAVARAPVGIDVEAVDSSAEIPWNVLHPREAACLNAIDDMVRARAFARLWSLKEAYLKALGVGLTREPSSFAVDFIDDGHATIEDPAAVSARVADATSIWRTAGELSAAISVVLLDEQRRIA